MNEKEEEEGKRSKGREGEGGGVRGGPSGVFKRKREKKRVE